MGFLVMSRGAFGEKWFILAVLGGYGVSDLRSSVSVSVVFCCSLVCVCLFLSYCLGWVRLVLGGAGFSNVSCWNVTVW